MTHANYEKFIKVCNEQLDREKYYFQEGRKDWPLNYSKVRLRHTRIEELEDGGITPENQGIFVDVFKLDHVPDRNFRGKWQYFCAKVWLAYMLSCRTYTSASSKKKWIMRGSKLLRIKCVEHFFSVRLSYIIIGRLNIMDSFMVEQIGKMLLFPVGFMENLLM